MVKTPPPTKEEIIKYYIEENHKYYDTIQHFELTEVKFLELLSNYNIQKKRHNLKQIIKGESSALNIDEILNFYRDHSYEETLKEFNIYSQILDPILKNFNSNKKFKEKKRALTSFEEYINRISKEDLYNYYIIENHCYRDTLIYFNIPSGMFEKICNYYNIQKSKKRPRKTQFKDVKNIISKNIIFDLYIDQNLCINDCILKLNKMFGIDITIDCFKKLCEYYSIYKRRDYQYLINEQVKNTCLEKYGVENTFQLENCTKNSIPYQSGPNKEFQHLLDSLGLTKGKDYEDEFPLGHKRYDFKINNYLIEIDPWATHNITWKKYNCKQKWSNYMTKEYHRDKTLLALKNDYICIHLFDWMDKEFIINAVLNNEIEIKDTKECKKYFYNYKKNILVEEMGPWTVEIWDDGFELKIGGN